MITNEHDPDVLSWGLQFLHGDSFLESGYCESPNDNNAYYYEREYPGEINYDPVYPSLDHHEVIAPFLQEEFSQLAVIDDEEHQKQSLISQHLYGSPGTDINSGT